MSVADLLTRLDALEARLDAGRQRAEAPGQMALDLTGGSRPTGGGGEKCGSGWIDPRKTCRKGTASQAAAASEPPPSEARRSRPQERVAFEQPITGPTGAKLTAYTWKWTHDLVPDKDGDLVEKRVSNWEESLQNVETGRQVVHQFEVEVGGETRVVSAESALKVLGFVDPADKKRFGSLKSTARTVARLRMALQLNEDQQKRFEADRQEVEELPKPEIKAGDWRPYHSGNGIEERTWQMGDVSEHELRFPDRGRGSTDEEMASGLRRAWVSSQMATRGWGKGQAWEMGHLSTRFTSIGNDLKRRLARAEAKLQTTTRADSPSSRLDALEVRTALLWRRAQRLQGVA